MPKSCRALHRKGLSDIIKFIIYLIVALIFASLLLYAIMYMRPTVSKDGYVAPEKIAELKSSVTCQLTCAQCFTESCTCDSVSCDTIFGTTTTGTTTATCTATSGQVCLTSCTSGYTSGTGTCTTGVCCKATT